MAATCDSNSFLSALSHKYNAILQAKPKTGSERVLEFFLQYESDAYLKMMSQYNITSPSCAIVLNHGDYWNSNIMIRQNPETKTPEQCVAIDWQVGFDGVSRIKSERKIIGITYFS